MDKPEALRLADWCDTFNTVQHSQCAAELRRLYQLAMDQQGEIYALKMAHSMEQKTAALALEALDYEAREEPSGIWRDVRDALRLADDLEDACLPTFIAEEAAAELRRLHAQRDALLEALKQIEPILARMYGPQAAELPPMQIVRAAVSAFEGDKT